MRRLFIVAILLTAVAFVSSAHTPELAPGLYTVIGEDYVPLKSVYGTACMSGKNVMGYETNSASFRYKEETSGTDASDTFILITDPDKKDAERKMKGYNPFIRSMSPDRIIIIPLTINPETGCREYDSWEKVHIIKVNNEDKMRFKWEKKDKNVFELKIIGLTPGEYGFVFNLGGRTGFDYSAIFGFTIPASETETASESAKEIQQSVTE